MPVSGSPSPHTLSLHAALQWAPAWLLLCPMLSVPSSHSSFRSRMPLPQKLAWQNWLQLWALSAVPLAAPSSQVSLAMVLRTPSPHLANVQLLLQAALSCGCPLLPASQSSPGSTMPSPQPLSWQNWLQWLGLAAVPLSVPSSQASPAAMLRWPSPHTGSVQSGSQSLASIPPLSHCSTPESTLWSPHTLIWHAAVHAAESWFWLTPPTVPLSHCSGPGPPVGVNARLTIPSPHAGLVQLALQLAVLTPPSSHASTPVNVRWSPHTLIWQVAVQAALSLLAAPLSHCSGPGAPFGVKWRVTLPSPQFGGGQAVLQAAG